MPFLVCRSRGFEHDLRGMIAIEFPVLEQRVRERSHSGPHWRNRKKFAGVDPALAEHRSDFHLQPCCVDDRTRGFKFRSQTVQEGNIAGTW